MFLGSITTIIVGAIKEIQWCIIGGIISLFGSAMVGMGIMINASYSNKTSKPPSKPAVKPATTTTNIINPIYETV